MSPLRKKMFDDMTIRGLSDSTKNIYINAVTGLVQHYGRRPDTIEAQQVQDYLLFLHEERGLSWSTCNTCLYGIRFFYRITLQRPEPHFYVPAAKQPSRLPEILNSEQLVRLFAAATNPKHRVILMMAYAAGLRVSELTRLRVCDIDSGRMVIRVKQGKGNKDRYVPLSPRLLDELRTYWRIGRPSHWLFPGQCADGNLSRHGIAAIYTAVKTKAGINNAGGIHTLRHCYATALLEAGVGLPIIQRRLGHASIRSTMRYLHLAMDTAGDTVSPLDLLESVDVTHA